MAQNLNFYGHWENVPYVTLPKTGGGVAKFTDVTDTTAAAADVDSSKYFYTAAGVRTKGTGNTGGTTINNQNKSVNPTESEQSVSYDSGYTGLGTVTVGAISSTYVGSGISRKSSSNLTASGATVTAPAGYYTEDATKSVSSMTLPSSASATSSGTSKATISRSTSNQYINIPTGYNSTAQYYTISAVADGTAGTPTATKGTVSNHSISVTPSVTNVTGYITGGTKTGTAVSIAASELVSGTKSISSNGTGIDVTNYAAVDVAVPVASEPTIESLSVNPSTSEQTFNSSSVDGYKPVVVAAMPSMTLPTSTSNSATSGYTSKATVSRSTSDQYINIPTGYNAAGAYYKINAVANGSVTAPASISGTSATVSTGTNTLTLTKTVSVTPSVTTAGYISSGTAGNSSVSLTANVTVNPTPTANGATVTIPAGYYSAQTTKSVSSGSATGPSSLSGSSATVSTGTNTLTLTKTNVTTTPTVSAGYVSSATASSATVALTASVTTKAAATITPGTSDQTIAAGTYLTGAQTIAGDADLVASNIINGVQIFGVTGNVVLQNYYTGSSTPSSSLGSNGDIYIQQ